MEVDVGIQVVGTPGIHLGGVALRDVGVAQMLADDRAVLGLGQAVVVGMAWPILGEFGTEFVQHLGDLVVDVLRAVVGVKAQDAEREARQQRLDGRQQIGFADFLAGGDQLPLGDAIDGIDV